MSTADLERPVDIVRHVMGLVTQVKIDELAAYIHDDVVFEFPFPAAGTPPFKRGKDSFMEGFYMIKASFKHFALIPGQFYFDPEQNTVVAEFTSFGVLAATDTDYHNRYVGVFGFRDGKIALWREYLNPEICNAQMRPVFALLGQSGA